MCPEVEMTASTCHESQQDALRNMPYERGEMREEQPEPGIGGEAGANSTPH